MTSEMSSGGKYKKPAGHDRSEVAVRILIRGESSWRSCQPAGVGCKDCSGFVFAKEEALLFSAGLLCIRGPPLGEPT